jgi:acyl-CoA thioester hydrolase
VVWHGHFISYFEDARVAFGRRYGLSYEAMREAGLAAPIVSLECEFLRPARFGDELDVTARLHERESAKIEFSYVVTRVEDGATLAVGRTLQVFSDLEGELVLTMPAIMKEFYRKWSGEMAVAGE